MSAEYDKVLGDVKQLSEEAQNKLQTELQKIKEIRVFKKQFDLLKPYEFALTFTKWTPDDDPMFDTSNVVIGKLDLLIEVATADRYDREDIHVVGVLDEDQYTNLEHENEQSKWVYTRGNDFKWIEKFLWENPTKLNEQANSSEIDWFCTQVDHDDDIVGSFVLTIYAVQKRISFMKLRKNHYLLFASGEDGEEKVGEIKKDGVYFEDEFMISKKDWNENNHSYFYIKR